MSVNYYDQACRYLLRNFRKPLLSWLFQLPSEQVDMVDWLDTRNVPWPGESDRFCDTVIHLRDTKANLVPWAIAIEFQIDPDPLMFGRALGYLSGLWTTCRPSLRRDRFQVGMIVINLRARVTVPPTCTSAKLPFALNSTSWNIISVFFLP